jgi:phosphatidylglycerophosphate synthase
MSFWQKYRAQLKPLSVEEPIDVVWHRFVAFGIASAASKTPITADQITLTAIFVGIASGVCIGSDFPHHMLWGAGLLTFSAILDCADGQLARMRKSSSVWGRMLDGFCDLIVMIATLAGILPHLHRLGHPWWMLVLAVAGGIGCSFHFVWYDHYKNVYLRFTEASYREGEDLEQALERRRAQLKDTSAGIFKRMVWWVYMQHPSGQAWLIRWSDPFSSTRLDRFPAYDPARAAIYAKHVLGPMRVWRGFYGLGSHIFLLSIAIVFDRIDIYIWYRLVAMNLFAFLVLLPWQRRASRAAFEEMGVRLDPSPTELAAKGAT